MEYRRQITIREVRTARLLVRQLHESGGAPAGGTLTEEMHKAVLALQERMANLDHQWQRALMLDYYGIFVYDEQGQTGGSGTCGWTAKPKHGTTDKSGTTLRSDG